MSTVGFVVLERTADGLQVDHLGQPYTREQAIDVVATCGATNGGEWLLARVVVDEED